MSVTLHRITGTEHVTANKQYLKLSSGQRIFLYGAIIMVPRAYDNTSKIVGFLDKHLAFRVLKYLEDMPGYNKADVYFTEYSLLRNSKLYDQLTEIAEKLYELSIEVEQSDFTAEKAELQEKIKTPSDEISRIMDVLDNESFREMLRPNDRIHNAGLIQEKCEVDNQAIASLFEFGQLHYEAGLYTEASRILANFILITNNIEEAQSATWGRMAADIMSEVDEYNGAYDHLTRIKESIDRAFGTPHLTTLQQRTWLLHWSLFVFMNHERGSDGLLDLFLRPDYLNCIQASAPWLLRYVVAMVITNVDRRSQLREVAKLVAQETYHLDDPVCDFLKALYVDVDFDKAAKALHECPTIFRNDYFLADKTEYFLTSARQLFFDICSIVYSSISIKELTKLLTFESEADTYEWVESMGHEVDRDHGVLNVEPVVDNVYIAVYDKMKTIIMKTQGLEEGAGRRDEDRKKLEA